MKPKRTAIVYDFDGTLSPGSMQEYSLLKAIGYNNPKDFWDIVKKECKKRDGDEVLTYMQQILTSAQPKGIKIDKNFFYNHGKSILFFDGVVEWFARINKYAEKMNLILEHYVISSGIREMIEGTSISNNFKKIFASSFAYNEASKAAEWPSVSINYTTKTQFLFRINKGIENTWDNSAINKWIPMQERPIPFERMVFIGDGDTDIPSMKMVRMQGGSAIAVFDPDKPNQDKMGKLIAEDRASYVAPANYEPNNLLDVIVKGILGRIARESGYRPRG
ncbi:haloacid dehalogenase-like hydrolase [Zymomonas mobilis]|uniref:Haloacid dehalogenase-like hydrolase n=1 Tax=Zymomonas mobilis TaxID=542 RepID=A0A542VZ35_ZYMMB|nr:HAD family hydrolase [Zymomonas mobilis]TQL16553.1 haloacid dehalogenase-like hydrolase [Zymomonas mobilis]